MLLGSCRTGISDPNPSVRDPYLAAEFEAWYATSDEALDEFEKRLLEPN
jgi:hypothetical protein